MSLIMLSDTELSRGDTPNCKVKYKKLCGRWCVDIYQEVTRYYDLLPKYISKVTICSGESPISHQCATRVYERVRNFV